MPRVIAAVISSRLATLRELQTVYGPEDAYALLEIHAVDQINRKIANEPK
ncbi:transcription elongation factor GreA [Rhodovarius crocodyli]|uniref:Transcription elongation factor GreA n=1 Tax=Rhodovarius crocodyli TaxID=1979269 RepID=A0A437MCG4_9PROT|nr:transcription elongation factor GreA [Rhodovarius crocodyli]RVT95253.1 transcription elongation factor GreA [Rhodovarius crocodyli]